MFGYSVSYSGRHCVHTWYRALLSRHRDRIVLRSDTKMINKIVLRSRTLVPFRALVRGTDAVGARILVCILKKRCVHMSTQLKLYSCTECEPLICNLAFAKKYQLRSFNFFFV